MTVFDVIKARLEGAGYPVHDTVAVNEDGSPVERNPYFVMYGGNPENVGDKRLTSKQSKDSDHDVEFTVRAVSSSAAGARGLAAIGFAQLVGWVPDVAGRAVGAVTHEGSSPVAVDDKVLPAVCFADDDYKVTNSRK